MRSEEVPGLNPRVFLCGVCTLPLCVCVGFLLDAKLNCECECVWLFVSVCWGGGVVYAASAQCQLGLAPAPPPHPPRNLQRINNIDNG